MASSHGRREERHRLTNLQNPGWRRAEGGRTPRSMDLRLTGCCAGALLLHGALLVLGSIPSATPVARASARLDETSVELLEPPPPEPPPEPSPADAPAPETTLPRLAARALAPQRATPSPSAASPTLGAAPTEAPTDADGAPVGGAQPAAPREHLSPEQ